MLRETAPPKPDTFFHVEKILGERKNPKTKKLQHKVRFLGYG